MSKKRIIILSVLLSIVTLLIILFGVVFCLRKVDINTLSADEYPLYMYQINEKGNIDTDNDGKKIQINITQDMLLKAAGLRKGTPIFSVNKEKAKNNIESTYPSIKVVQIKTVSAIRVEIEVRQRVGMYYMQVDTEFDSNIGFYVLDEDLVILDKLGIGYDEEIKANYTELALSDDTVITRRPYYDKLSTSVIQNYTYNIFNAVCSTVTVKDEAGVLSVSNKEGSKFIERNTFSKVVNKVTLSKVEVDDRFAEQAKDLYWVTMQIKDGNNVRYIQIYRPDKDLIDKVNLSFSALSKLTEGNDVIVCTYQEGKIALVQKSSV